MSGGAGGRPPPDGRGVSGPSASRLATEGEARVAAWYEGHGYEVLDLNWRRREGQVDLIVRQGRTVVFCEMETRTSHRLRTGADPGLEARQRRIRRLAARWLSEITPAAGRHRVGVRFDVASITGDQLEIVEDAFEA